MNVATPQMNPILTEIMQNAFALIAEEMGVTLQKTSYSTNIKDRLDFSCALYTPDGQLVAQAEHIPLHLGQMTAGIKNLLKTLKTPVESGSVYMVNDPIITGAHFPDILMMKGVFHQETLIGIVANLAHHVDVGGFAPGSLYSGASEAFQEGVRVPPVRLVRKGEFQPEIMEFFLCNTRTERENRGDCLAQVAALAAGERKLLELTGRYDPAMVQSAMAAVISYAERRIRAAMEGLPIAEAAFRDVIEGDGHTSEEIPIVVKVTSGPGHLSFDFTGSSPQVRGPINATFPFTLACVAFCVKALLDPTTPANEGMFAPLEMIVPGGSILNAAFPAAMSNNSSILGLRIVDAIFGALSQIFPENVTAASSGTMNVVTIGGFDPARQERFAYIESYGGGQGGSKGLDGMDGVHTTTSNTRNASAEAIERYYPITVRRYGLVDNSAGMGEYRGGLGLFREFEFRADTIFSLVSDRKAKQPWGLFGGEEGSASCCILTGSNGSETVLPAKVTHAASAGSKLYLATAGGGGYGSQAARSAERRDNDQRNGFIECLT